MPDTPDTQSDTHKNHFVVQDKLNNVEYIVVFREEVVLAACFTCTEVDAHEQAWLHDDLSRRMAYQVPQMKCYLSFRRFALLRIHQVLNRDKIAYKHIKRMKRIKRIKLLRYGYDPDRFH